MILVFSLEIMFRSLRRSRFKPRGRWTVLICVAVVILLTLALWLSAFLSKANEMCWGSLLWWMIHYGRVALVLVAGLLLTNLVTAAILIIQLVNTPEMDKSERISATRVVYSLGMNAVILVCVLLELVDDSKLCRHSYYRSGLQLLADVSALPLQKLPTS